MNLKAKAVRAAGGRGTSDAISRFKQSSSGRKALDSRFGKSVKAHPYRYGAGAAVGMGAMASGRRRSGLDRPQGRPTGMRNY